MRAAVFTSSVCVALMLVGWAAGASTRLPPPYSPADTQRGRVVHSQGARAGGPYSARYCGPGSAVIRVDGKAFTIRGGRCTSRRLGFGRVGVDGRGVWLLLGAANRTGRNDIVDGAVQLPGVSTVAPLVGTAVVAKGLMSATFEGSSGAKKVRGGWTCGLRV